MNDSKPKSLAAEEPEENAGHRAAAKLVQDRRKQILRAAVRVFATRGFHRTRVSDIAREAGVAYGLIYHYFQSKDDVLNSVFEENWAVFLKIVDDIAASPDKAAGEKLVAIAALLVDALQVAPELIQVIIQEVSRSDRFVQSKKVEAFQGGFSAVERILIEGQARGELRKSLDPRVAAYAFFGALETICTGVMIGQIQCASAEEALRVKKTIAEMILGGMKEVPAP